MSSLTPAQRRAEEFAALVDDPDGATAASARDSDMLELVGAMRSVPATTARPEFVASLRERLMIEAEVALSPDSAERRLTIVKTHSPRRRDRRVAILAGTIAAIGATSSVAMASQARSEEHTSELQSLMRSSYAVFFLKKKKPKPND